MSQTQASESQLCKNCCQFYGKQETDFLCSKCYKSKANSNKDYSQKPASNPEDQGKKDEEKKENETKAVEISQTDKSKCWNCSRKLGVMGFDCKCGYTFCNMHRLPEIHNCSFDFSNAAREKLKAQNPLVKGSKLDKL